MNEERSVVHGCTPGMVIPQKYLPDAPEQSVLALPYTGDEYRNDVNRYGIVVFEESRWIRFIEGIPETIVCELLSYRNRKLTFKVWDELDDIGRFYVGGDAGPEGKFVTTAGAIYPTLPAMLDALGYEVDAELLWDPETFLQLAAAGLEEEHGGGMMAEKWAAQEAEIPFYDSSG